VSPFYISGLQDAEIEQFLRARISLTRSDVRGLRKSTAGLVVTRTPRSFSLSRNSRFDKSCHRNYDAAENRRKKQSRKIRYGIVVVVVEADFEGSTTRTTRTRLRTADIWGKMDKSRRPRRPKRSIVTVRRLPRD